MQQGVKRLVLDVLKPHEPHLTELATRLCATEGIEGVNIYSVEIDQDTESIKVTIEGEDIDFTHVKAIMKDCGAVIHSIDEVAVGKRLIEKVSV